MKERRKLKLKKFYFHPVTVFIVLSLIVVLLSAVLSGFEMQATYNTVNATSKEMETTIVAVENLLSFDGMKFIISNAATNFISFAPLVTLLISLIGLSIAEATGFIEAFSRKNIRKLSSTQMTFIVIFLATISSLINEIGYAILIPLVAMFYASNGRNPLTGIVTAFCGVAFGYGVSIFVGSMEVSLMDYTAAAAALIDQNTHISLTSNLIFIIAATIILSIVGTIIIEKIISPKLGKYKVREDMSKTEELRIIDLEEEEQQKIEREKSQKRGLRFALISFILVVIAFIYMVIPGLPNSGMLLDMEEVTYLGQVFGPNSYFQDGFTYMMSILFLLMGIAYGIGAKSIKNDKELIEKSSKTFSKSGSIILLMFVMSQFIAIFKETNIGVVITAWFVNLIEYLGFSGIPLIILTLVLIAASNLFITTPAAKWSMFAPVVVPMFMQSNISPQFAQIVMRAADSMTNGITPLLGCFAIYIGYLNIYNFDSSKPITIRRSIKILLPYFGIIFATWLLLIVGWYIIGLPIGPGVYPTI
ncbi:MAG: AbgT family transporter [Bacilli bacterium]|nr:AbgT family transporter [Bacilli bacterium]